MSSISERPLRDDLSFGARVTGIDRRSIDSHEAREQVLDIFERRGLIVFEDVEPSSEMQAGLATLFGPLRHHALEGVGRVETGASASFMELSAHPDEADIFEVDGTRLAGFTPWHWDACYVPQIYRGGLLRALEIPPEGGLTGFADGVQLYQAISPELRDRFETLDIVYQAGLMMMNQRFGLPRNYRAVDVRQNTLDMIDTLKTNPRAVHPAIWQRRSGEKVLHVSPWQAAGIEGQEDAEGDALLEALCQEIYAKMEPYRHSWKATDMVVWDNWRFIHSVSGHNPAFSRRVHRATIEGDYGLGRLEAKALA